MSYKIRYGGQTFIEKIQPKKKKKCGKKGKGNGAKSKHTKATKHKKSVCA